MKHASSPKMLAVLTSFAVVVGAVLALSYQGFYPKIEANRIAEEKRAIFAVLTGAQDYEIMEREAPTGEIVKIFKGKDADGKIVGYAFLAIGPGFSANIKMMVGLEIKTRKLTGMKVIDHLETPGLGTKIEDDKFRNQFIGLDFEPKIEYLKNKIPEKPNQIKAITGATISSVAIVKAINNRIKVVIGMIEAEGY